MNLPNLRFCCDSINPKAVDELLGQVQKILQSSDKYTPGLHQDTLEEGDSSFSLSQAHPPLHPNVYTQCLD